MADQGAQRTKRHVVQLDLAKISTNEELMEVMYKTDYTVQGLEFPVKLSFEDVIFIMEDIDASEIVLSRVPVQESMEDFKDKALHTRRGKKTRPAAGGAEEGEEEGENTLAVAEASADSNEAPAAETRAAAASPAASPADIAAATAAGILMALDGDGGNKKKKEMDKLDLSGLLNVLDGIVDTPGRIVIMTTNHPEKLDKALIRPGRIDKPIYLGFMNCHQAGLMIEHYYPPHTLTEEQALRLRSFLGTGERLLPPRGGFDLGTSGGRTPAAVEQQCSEFATVDLLLDALEGKILTEYEQMNLEKEKLRGKVEAISPLLSPRVAITAAKISEENQLAMENGRSFFLERQFSDPLGLAIRKSKSSPPSLSTAGATTASMPTTDSSADGEPFLEKKK